VLRRVTPATPQGNPGCLPLSNPTKCRKLGLKDCIAPTRRALPGPDIVGNSGLQHPGCSAIAAMRLIIHENTGAHWQTFIAIYTIAVSYPSSGQHFRHHISAELRPIGMTGRVTWRFRMVENELKHSSASARAIMISTVCSN
jgi:hypothetical protein